METRGRPVNSSVMTTCGPNVTSSRCASGANARWPVLARSSRGPADLPTGEQPGGLETGQLAVRGRQRDAEPGREVGGGVVVVRVQEQHGEQVGLVSGPEHWHQRRRVTTHRWKISSNQRNFRVRASTS